jgi:hypothetical protein
LIAKYIACNNDTIGKTKEFIALMGEGEKIELRQANASKTRKEEKCITLPIERLYKSIKGSF